MVAASFSGRRARSSAVLSGVLRGVDRDRRIDGRAGFLQPFGLDVDRHAGIARGLGHAS